MGALSVVFAFAARLLLVLLFLPFSALDKVLNFRGAEAQAADAVGANFFATTLVILGLMIEVFMSLGVLTGVADRAAAFVLAGYCGVTALLWKQFWAPGDFWRAADGKGRALFWDFPQEFRARGRLSRPGLRQQRRDGRRLLRPSVRDLASLCVARRGVPMIVSR